MNARTALARMRIGVAPVVAAALAAALLLGGCLAEQENIDTAAGGGGGTGGTVITWTDLTSSGGALNANCSCHNSATSTTGDLSLHPSKYTTIVVDGQTGTGGVRIVDPGNSAGSLLYQKVNTGGSMSGYANAAAVADIKAWIDAGAPEN